jgi:hypothetical protein
MKILKRRILLENSIDRTENSLTYGTLTATTFYLNIIITKTIDDMGIMTDMDKESGPDTLMISDYFNFGGNVLTATTDSKLFDVRGYKELTPYLSGFDTSTETYTNFSGGTLTGVNRVIDVGETMRYVLGGDKNSPFIGQTGQTDGLLYEESSGGTISTLTYRGQGWNETNVTLSALTKQEYLFGIISPPEIENDVFIDRSTNSVMERHLKLSEVKTLDQLQRYGNGFYNVNKI